MEHTLLAIRRSIQDDSQTSRENLRELARHWEREWQRWERLRSQLDRCRKILGGKPNRIERNAVVLLF